MSTVRLILPGYHPGQAKIDNGLKRFNVMACGRRFGKDVYEMNKTIEPTLQGYDVGFAAPTYKTLMENWRAINNLVAPIIKRRNAQEMRLELTTGGSIDFWSLDNPDLIRGRKYKRFTINEAGFVRDLMEIWNFIIRPTLIDYAGDGFFGGTPKGMNGFWQMYQRGLDPQIDDWACWQLSSYENPYIPKSEIDKMVEDLPDRVVQQEIFAQFLPDAGGVFRRVMEATSSQELSEAQPGHQYIAGVDVATLVDFTAVSVFDVGERRQVYLDRFNRVDYSVLEDRLEGIYKRFNLSTMIIEANSIGQPVIEAMVSRDLSIIPFTTTNATKQAAIQDLQAAFEHSEIKILNDPIQIGELQAYEGERTPSGAWRYGSPEGMHDDTVMAMTIAWSGIGGRLEIY